MGKSIKIAGVDFSINAIPIAKAVEGTLSPQYVYVANVLNPSVDFDWDAHKVEVQISSDGSITSFNLPQNTAKIPYFFKGSEENNEWIKVFDLSYLSGYPLTSISSILSRCSLLERVVIGGSFPVLSDADATSYFVYKCNNINEVIIDKDFNAPNLTDISTMFYQSGIKSVKGLRHLIKSSVQNLASLFNGCANLREVDLTGCNTENVSNFSLMFRLCENLERIIGINELDTEKVSNFSQMFEGCGNFGTLDISKWTIAANANTFHMFSAAKVYDLNANCFTALYGDISYMFYLNRWNTIHLDNLNDISAVTQSTYLFSPYVTGSPKVTIENVTSLSVKTFLINALNNGSIGGSSDWHEATVDGVLCLVP